MSNAIGPASKPILVFERVVFATGSYDGAFEAGLYTLLGSQESGAALLLKLASGEIRPKRGHVRLDGTPPYGSPELRRRVATATGATLPPLGTVRALIDATAELHGHRPERSVELLVRWGCQELLDRTPRQLRQAERARVDLAIAMAHEHARVLALWQPFDAGVDERELRGALEQRARSQIVLVGGERPLAPPLPGRIIHFGGARAEARPASRRDDALSLWIGADDVESLAHELLRSGCALGAEVLHGRPGLLRVDVAPEPASVHHELCRAVLEIAASRGIRVLGISLEERT
jgi:ABC-type uncharacterized transport system YnjBCD ATPase subunit